MVGANLQQTTVVGRRPRHSGTLIAQTSLLVCVIVNPIIKSLFDNQINDEFS